MIVGLTTGTPTHFVAIGKAIFILTYRTNNNPPSVFVAPSNQPKSAMAELRSAIAEIGEKMEQGGEISIDM